MHVLSQITIRISGLTLWHQSGNGLRLQEAQQSISARSDCSAYSHCGLLSTRSVSWSPLSEQSALGPPAGLPEDEHLGLRQACLKAACT